MTSRRTLLFYRIALVVAAIVLLKLAWSETAYNITSPKGLPHHLYLRKTYALGAFALLGALWERARIPHLRTIVAAAIAVGCYSAGIELGQIHAGVDETIGQHGFDIASGVAGGAVGAVIANITLPAGAARPMGPVQFWSVAAVLVATILAFFPTYGG